MKPAYKLLTVIFVGSILFFTASWLEDSLSKNDAAFIELGKLSFHTSIQPGIDEAKNLSKPVFLYFRSNTCYWCLRFEEEALSDQRIINILNKSFILISIDIIKQEKTASNLNVRNTPYMIFFTEDGEEISRIPGYLPADGFLDELQKLQEKFKLNRTS